MQIPYDSGFAIVRDADAHRRAMDISASYLNADPEDGRNPTHFGPELSRRARGFAAWAVFQSLGRDGVRQMVERHCRCAARIAEEVARIPGLRVANEVRLNQVIIAPEAGAPEGIIATLSARLNHCDGAFVRATRWNGEEMLRISVISPLTGEAEAERLAAAIRDAVDAIG